MAYVLNWKHIHEYLIEPTAGNELPFTTHLHADTEVLGQEGHDVIGDIRADFIVQRDGANREAERTQGLVQRL